MTTDTLTLTDFLLARIAEDEDVARGRFVSEKYDEGARYFWQYDREGEAALATSDARVLAECEAKRRIVELHTPANDYGKWVDPPNGYCPTCVAFHADMDCENEVSPCATLRALALPYADHPDYRDEWRP